MLWMLLRRIIHTLKGVLPKDYARPALDKQRLGELIDLIGSITLVEMEQERKGKGCPWIRI